MNIKNNKNCKITINDEGRAVSEKEKTADELFKELGYEKIDDEDELIEYMSPGYKYNCDSKFIRFDKNEWLVTAFYPNEKAYVDMGELQAINKKVLELGWLKKES